MIAQAFALWAEVAPDRDTAARRFAENEFVWAVAAIGLETPVEARARALDPLGRPQPSTIRRVMETLGHPASSTDLSAAAVALGPDGSANLPPKTEWVLAADGSGDATTMQEILSRSAGRITIRVRPGFYRAEADWSDAGLNARDPLPMEYNNKWRVWGDEGANPTPVGPLFAASRAMSSSKTHEIALIGEPGAVFEETFPVRLAPNMRVEGLTLQFSQAFGHAVTLDHPSVMTNVRIEILDQIDGADLPAGVRITSPESVEMGRNHPSPPASQLSNVTITTRSDPLENGIQIDHGAIARIFDVEITGVRADAACVRLLATRDVTVRNNNLRACAPLMAIRAPAPSTNLIFDNAGALVTPVLERGMEQDFYRY